MATSARIGFGEQSLIPDAAQKRAEDRLPRRRAAQELAMNKRARQHRPAFAGGNQESESLRQGPKFALVVDQVDSD